MPPKKSKDEAPPAPDEPERFVLVGSYDGFEFSLPLPLDGRVYNRVELDLWNACGLTMGKLVDAIREESRPPFVFAALVYLARRMDGQAVDYDQLVAGWDWDKVSRQFEIVPAGAGEGDRPEA